MHSWSDPSLINRTLGVGGFVAGYAFSASDDGQGNPTFLAEWRTNKGLANGSKISGYGIGTDVNGLGTQPAPRLNAGSNPLTYPFTATNGTQVAKQVYGSRTFDLNTDGVAQYGLYPDYIVDLINQAGADGPLLRRQLLNGAEAYTSMWEKARA